MLTAQSNTILIVDNQPGNLKMLFSFLQESGYKVLVAKRGESAIKKLQKVSPDLILLDMILPGIDGFETCRRLKASPETQDIPIIFMTASLESIDKIRGLKVGAVDYITKPFQQAEVLARIENQLKIRRLSKQLEEQNKRLQQEISNRRKLEERLELVIQVAKDGFWDWNLESGEIYASPRCKEMLGYSEEELPNEFASWENYVFSEDRNAALKLVEDFNSGQVSHFESIQRFHHKNGSTVHILVRALQLKDANGRVNRLIGAYTDITEITNTLEALRSSRRLLASVLSSSLDGVAAFSALRDAQGNIVDFIWLLLNPAAEKIMGRTESELIGQQMLVEMPGICETGMFEKYVSVVETGEALETEHYYVAEHRKTRFQVAVVKLGDGFAMTFRDITERKQMEQQNQALLNAIPDIMFRQRVDGTYLDVRSKEDTPTIVPADLIGKNLLDNPVAVPEAVKQGIFEHLQAAVETGKIQIYEYEISLPDGVHTYESRCVKSGVDEAIRIVRDVTRRKRSEAALRQSEAQFRGIFENAAIGIGLIGVDGKLIEANPTLEAFLGYSSCEIRGQDFATITYPDDRETDFTLTSEVIDGVRDSFQIEKRYIRKDGQIFWGRLTVSAVRNLVGEFQFTVAIVEDITEHKKAEEDLRLLKSVVVNANDAVIITEAESISLPGPKIIYVNESFTRMTGYSKEEAIGKTPRILQGAKTDRAQLEKIRQALQTWQSVRVELINYRKDGSEFWVELEIVPVADETGWFTHWVSVQRDITERKLAQEALLIARKRLEYLLFSSPSVIYSCQITEPHSTTFLSENVTAIHGYEPQEFTEDSSFWISRIHPDDIDRVLSKLPQLFEVGHHSDEYRFLTKDGTYRWVLDAIKIVRDEEGNPIECIGSWIDITQCKQAEELSRLLERAIAASGNAIAISDAQAPGNPIIYVNSGFERMTGFQREDIIGSQYCSFMRMGATPTVLEEMRRAIAQGQETQVTLYTSRKDGTMFWNELCITPVRDDRGRLTHFISVQTDISDRKQVEEALRISEQRLHLALEASGMGFWDWKLNTGQAFFNPKWKTMLGYEIEEIENSYRSWEQLVHPEDLPDALEALNAHFEGRSPIYVIEVRMLSKSGEWKWIFSQGKVMERDESGAPVRMTGTHLDISDRKQAEEALRQQKELLQTIFDHIPVMVAFFDAKGQIQLVNREVERVLGWSPSDLGNLDLLAECYPDLECRQLVVEQVRAATGKWQDFKTRTRDGRYVDTSWADVRLSDGTSIGIGQDITERKLAEERLRLLERAIAASNNGIVISDAQACNNPIIYVNSGFERMTGYRTQEVIGNPCCSFEGTCATPTVLEEVQCAIAEGRETQVTLHNSRKDGTMFWSDLCITPVRDRQGRLTHFIGVQTDISERVLAQESLRESEERFRTMADSTSVILWISGTDAQCTFVNKTCLEFTGRTLEEELGLGWLDCIHPDDRQRCRKTYLKAFEVRESFEMEYRLLRFDGEYRWIVELGKPRFTRNGNFTGYIGSCIDITERKQAVIEITTAKTALERQINRVLLLERINQEIRSSLNPEQIFQTAATQIGKAFSANRCLIYTYIEQPIPQIPFAAEYKQPGMEFVLNARNTEIPVIGNPHAQSVLSQDSAIASDDVYADPLLEPAASICQQFGLKSMLAVRTSYQGKPNGVIGIHQYDGFRHWTEAEIELLESVAAQMGIAIAQANLLAQEKQRRQKLDEQNHQLQQEIRERQRAELALQENQRFIEAVADANPSLLYLYDLNEQRNVYTNSKLSAILGYTPKEVQEMGAALFTNLMHPEDLAKFPEVFQKVASSKDGDIIEFEYRMRHKDGSWRWLSSRDTVFARNPDGTPRQTVGTATDISDRKLAEIELAAAKTSLEKQIQRALLLGQITQEIRSSLNPEQIFQTAATQIGIAFSVNRCLIHTYLDRLVPQIPVVAEYKQAEIESVLSLEIPVIGNPHAQLLLAQDSASASDNVYTDPLLEAASYLCQQLGLKSMLAVRTSYQGKPNGLIAVHQYDDFRSWQDEEIELLEAVAAQVGIAIAQANLLEQEIQRRQELAAQNHELEKAKHEAEAANRAKSQFLSKMSHELRTPLNAILGFTQVMARDDSLSKEQLKHLGIINRSGEHLLELINDILSMSKIEAGQVILKKNCFDLYQLLDSLEEMLQFQATSKGLQLIFERTPDLPQYIQTDERKLRQILINLLGNALKFTQTGCVTLRVDLGKREENHSTPYSLIFKVEDTGPGIAPEEIDTIFDLFVQTKTGRQSMEGTGLGLPISRQFARMMGGDITANSTLGRGTIFTFDIQINLATSADEKSIPSKQWVISLEPNQPSYRILVVEDVLENRQLLVEMLGVLGFEVREASNGQEGVALWESWSPHLICMDILMPVMDGYQATRQIKQTPKGKDTVIIALTASAFEEQREAILRVGCDDFLPKPFQQEVLLEKIAHHLGVRYLYEEEQLPISCQSLAPEELLTPEALSVMPASWVTQLHQAALYADDELMNQLIEQIPLEHGCLRHSLKEMLNNFCLEQLIDLTDLAGL